jgi:protein-tyrosine phosphatase
MSARAKSHKSLMCLPRTRAGRCLCIALRYPLTLSSLQGVTDLDQGKDRTGLVVMLILLLLKTDLGIIDKDYQLSESELAAEMEERLREIGAIGLSRQFALCPSDLVPSVNSHILERYGSVEQYLEKAGVTKEQIDFVKRKLSAHVS